MDLIIPPNYEGMSKKKQGYFALAAKTANESTYGNYRHGAVLVKGGNVISIGFNRNSHCTFAQRFRKEQEGNATLHAELSAILGLDKSQTRNADIYVVRVGNLGDFKMSKPCPMCFQALKFVGVSRAFFSIDEQSWGMIKLLATL
jgi:tRNA(Arg) A34 adenosine deaminase TadA